MDMIAKKDLAAAKAALQHLLTYRSRRPRGNSVFCSVAMAGSRNLADERRLDWELRLCFRRLGTTGARADFAIATADILTSLALAESTVRTEGRRAKKWLEVGCRWHPGRSREIGFPLSSRAS